VILTEHKHILLLNGLYFPEEKITRCLSQSAGKKQKTKKQKNKKKTNSVPGENGEHTLRFHSL